MSEQDRNGAEIDSCFEQVNGEGVPKQMRRNGLADASRTRRFPAGDKDRFHRDRLPLTSAGKKPFRRPLASPVAAEQFAQLRRQPCLPVFPSFAGTHPQHVAGGIDVGHFDACNFTDSEPGPIENRQPRALAQIARRLPQCSDFVAAQNDRQLPFAPRIRNPFDSDLTYFAWVRNNW